MTEHILRARRGAWALGALGDRHHDPQFIDKENEAQKGKLGQSWAGRSWDSSPGSASCLPRPRGALVPGCRQTLKGVGHKAQGCLGKSGASQIIFGEGSLCFVFGFPFLILWEPILP